MIRNVLLLVAALLSVVLPPAPQLTLDRSAELSLPERTDSLTAVLDGGASDKATEKSSSRPAPKSALRRAKALIGFAQRVSVRRSPLVVVAETVLQHLPLAQPELVIDTRRLVRRTRALLQHAARDEDPSTA